eukprot:scaffold46900_cov52-Phaeocystis_antarctica.AAC.1
MTDTGIGAQTVCREDHQEDDRTARQSHGGQPRGGGDVRRPRGGGAARAGLRQDPAAPRQGEEPLPARQPGGGDPRRERVGSGPGQLGWG